jgi:hypothetical protein
MKLITFAILVFSLSALGADDFSKLSRADRCKNAGGEVSSKAVKAEATKTDVAAKGEHFPFGPIDCTCGGKRFNPLREGDVCKDGKIVTSLENYCNTSKGTMTQKTTDSKFALGPLKKCTCGDEEFNPTKTSMCTAGKITAK